MAKSVAPKQSMITSARDGLKARQAEDAVKCCTPTGIARARQLSNGQNISVDTLKRMKSFLSRHKVDLKAGTNPRENKGAQSIMLWGARPTEASIDATIKWIDNTLDRISS